MPPRSRSRRVIAALDATAARLYGWRFNPLHQSGTIAVAMLLLLLASGLYLVFVYRLGDPSDSVARIAADPWLGRWLRTLHRIASDLFIIAALVHAFRLWSQDRSWGARTLAWVSGTLLLGSGLLAAWTGFVMAWDTLGYRLAREGGRLFDALPFFSEPVSRIFAGDQPVPSAFFFVNLFLHIAIPLGIGVILWLHVSRVARPTLLPPRRLLWTLIAALTIGSIAMPIGFAGAADPLSLAVATPINLPATWWLPITERLSPVGGWFFLVAMFALMLAVPFLTRRRKAPSVVDPHLCTGCNQCPQDCPWGAITMVERDDDRPSLVALVDPTLCVSCGICAGSCAPMGVGPPGRTGRDQLAELRGRQAAGPARGIVVITCNVTPVSHREALQARGATLYPIGCVGNLHTSVVELLLRGGASGVLIAGCPPRDCLGREGPKWLHERLYNDREAELQARVDRRRVRTVTLGPGALAEATAEYDNFAAALGQLDGGQDEASLDDILELECDPVPIEDNA